MNRIHYLLLCLAEECNEVGQMASKCIRFGLSEIKSEQLLTNVQRLQQELGDLLGVVNMLERETGKTIWPTGRQMGEKREKVDKYYGYSQSLGLTT